MADDERSFSLWVLVGVTGTVALAGALGTVLWLVTGGAAPPPGSDDRLAGADWPADSGTAVELQLGSGTGPVWEHDAGSVALPPASPTGQLSWNVTDTRRGRRLVASTDRLGGRLHFTWILERGDPQLEFRVRTEGIPLARLREERISVRLELPTDAVRAIDDRLQLRTDVARNPPFRMPPSQPAWLQWGAEPHGLTLEGWTGDGATVRPVSEGEGLTLALHLWHPEHHPSLTDCSLPDSEDAESLEPTIRARGSITVGRPPPVVPSPIPDGRAAAVVPIFDTPGAHPAKRLQRARPNSPEDWVERAKTLAFGHSNSADPRYGNGGILGRGFGGTVVLPGKWRDAPLAREFAEGVENSGLDIALRGRAGGTDGDSGDPFWETVIADSHACRPLLTEGAPLATISNLRAYRGMFGDDVIHSAAPSTPADIEPYRLDGSRSTLVDSVFAERPLRSLVEHRDIAMFSTPLIGSRNPLIEAASDALLSPERNGQWTLTGRFSEALTSVEFVRESTRVWLGSISDLLDHWQRTRDSRRRWSSDGELLVRHAGESAVDGYTLLVSSEAIDESDVSVAEADAAAIHTSDPPTARSDAPAQRWITWTARPETTYRVSFGDGISAGGLAPIQWQLSH